MRMDELREVLYAIRELITDEPDCTPTIAATKAVMVAAINFVLAAPLRNCDVGTASAQEVRFDAFVRDRRGDLDCTGKCPAHNGVDFGVVACVLQWAQMPYEEEARSEDGETGGASHRSRNGEREARRRA